MNITNPVRTLFSVILHNLSCDLKKHIFIGHIFPDENAIQILYPWCYKLKKEISSKIFESFMKNGIWKKDTDYMQKFRENFKKILFFALNESFSVFQIKLERKEKIWINFCLIEKKCYQRNQVNYCKFLFANIFSLPHVK